MSEEKADDVVDEHVAAETAINLLDHAIRASAKIRTHSSSALTLNFAVVRE
jgi:hypothetical protein